MPRLTVCNQPGCPNDSRGPYCPEHTPAAWATSTRRQTLPTNWQRTRRAVLRRDAHTCQHCGNPATHVDHIVPHAEGGTDALANLQALCQPCHTTKTTTEATRARQRARTSTTRVG